MTEVDGKRVPNVMDSAHAPVITSAIRVPDEVDGGDGRGFYLEDAGQPETLRGCCSSSTRRARSSS